MLSIRLAFIILLVIGLGDVDNGWFREFGFYCSARYLVK
jgi:hypothetical protein